MPKRTLTICRWTCQESSRLASVCYTTIIMKGTSLISLDNYDPSRKKPPYLTSPRSLEACRRQGIDPAELLVKTKHEFTIEECKGLDKVAADLKYDHFLERRQLKFDLVRTERQKVIELEGQGLWSSSKSKGPLDFKVSVDSNLSSALIDREKKELERIQRRQQQEIQQIVEHEVNIETIRERNDEKTAKAKMKEAKHQTALRDKRTQQEIKKRQDEERKRRQVKEDTLLQRKLAKEQYERQQKKKEEDELRDKLRRKEAKERDRQAAKKREEFQKNTEDLLTQQQLKTEERLRELDEKEAKRKRKLEQQHQLKKALAARTQAQKTVKLEAAKRNLNSMLEEQRRGAELRQKKLEEKRLHIEEERKKAVEDARRRAEKKAHEIQRVIQANQTEEEERLLRLNEAKERLEERQAQLAEAKEKEMKDKAAKAIRKQQKIDAIREANVSIVNQRIEKVIDKQREKEEAVKKLKNSQRKMLVIKKTAEELKRQDRFEEVKRMARQQDYQREVVMDRIQEQYSRVQLISKEKQSILEQRKQLRKDVEIKKKQLMEKFERLKKQKGGIANSEELAIILNEVRVPQTMKDSSLATPSPKLKNYSPEPSTSRSLNPEKRGPSKSPNLLLTDRSTKSARSGLEETKRKLFQEMTDLLDLEKSREKKREAQLAAEPDLVQKDLLEKQFGLERALASQRILRLSE